MNGVWCVAAIGLVAVFGCSSAMAAEEGSGACCFPDGSCLEVGGELCASGGGSYQGDGTSCASVECASLGACCLAFFECLETRLDICEAAGGDFQGVGSDCKDVSCDLTGFGSCCFDGKCEVLSIEECSSFGGYYVGDVKCSGAACDIATGACCLFTGACVEASMGGCADAGGSYVGDFTICEKESCPEPLGACCLFDGDCIDTDPKGCDLKGGYFEGYGVDCRDISCPVMIGACCFAGGSCFESTEDGCLSEGGVYLGDRTLCDIKGFCPVGVGACCFSSFSCTEDTEASCLEAGGVYIGDGTFCIEGEVCPEPIGACCAPSSAGGLIICIETTPDQCEAFAGVYQGDETICEQTECDPMGACCIVDDKEPFCFEATEQNCFDLNGEYFGDDTFCEKVSCEGQGACCFEGGACSDLSEVDCSELGGVYQGDFTDCATETCSQPGDIELESPREFPALDLATRCATGDLDGDGLRDVVAVLPDESGADGGVGSVQSFLNEGTDDKDGWEGLDPGPVTPVGQDPSGVTTAFLNGDDALDAAVSNRGDDTVSILGGNGDGSFTLLDVVVVGDEPTDIIAGEFTGDGFTDLAVTLFGDGTIVVLENDGDAGFTEYAVLETGLPAEGGGVYVGFAALDPEDLEGDKDLDIIGTGRAIFGAETGAAVVFFQVPGGFEPGVLIPVGDDPVDITAGDVDGNGTPDILTADRGGVAEDGDMSTVSVIMNNGDGSFEPSVQFPAGMDARSIESQDLDADGDDDVAVAGIDPDAGPGLLVLEAQADEESELGLSFPIYFPVDADPNWVVSGDFNEDGLVDLVTCNLDDGPTDGSVTVLLNAFRPDCNGNGIADECEIFAGTVEDCNGNGIPDECETAVVDDPADSVAQDSCPDAELMCPDEQYAGDTLGTVDDTVDFCGLFFGVHDVWYRYEPRWDGLAFLSVIAPALQPVMIVYDACPSEGGMPIACNDPNPNGVVFNAHAGETYYVRFAGRDFSRGMFQLSLLGPACVVTDIDQDGNGIPDECECPADVNEDGVVDGLDYIQVLMALGPCDGCPEDVDGSGVVNDRDLQLVLIAQGPCPGPPPPPDPPTGPCD